MASKQTYTFPGTEMVDKAKELLREGNATRIRVKRKDKTIVDVSATLGATLAAAGLLAAAGAVAALARDSVVEIEHEDEDGKKSSSNGEHVEIRKHVERVVKSEMRHWLGAHEDDDWEEIGHKLISRVRTKMQEDKKAAEKATD